MTQAPHRILVLGGGSIGARHARNLLVLNAGEVTIFEPEEKRRKVLEEELKIPAIGNESEAFAAARPDIVFVCSPTALHIPQAIRAVEAGAHVFLEKPLSHTMEKAEELREKAEKGRRIVMVGCNMRFHPGTATVKRLLASGAIGTPIAARILYSGYLPAWRPQQDYRKSYSASPDQGGVVLDCIHEIDLALWYFGPGKVTGACVLPALSIGLETDGLAEMLVKHETGVLSSIHVNFIEQGMRRGCHILGSSGALSWDFTRGSVKQRGSMGKVTAEFKQPETWTPNQMYVDELQHFLDAVEQNKAPFGSLEEATQALKIALAVRTHQS
ncbi:MAG: Gfo/Idh/MocA family oxidoreductase [Candidatus Peribacteraceae bacterium]|nr:Gfo/Idh/MocA family oxidoreductase [Candidatus Peribacteraceae bacterium]